MARAIRRVMGGKKSRMEDGRWRMETEAPRHLPSSIFHLRLNASHASTPANTPAPAAYGSTSSGTPVHLGRRVPDVHVDHVARRLVVLVVQVFQMSGPASRPAPCRCARVLQQRVTPAADSSMFFPRGGRLFLACPPRGPRPSPPTTSARARAAPSTAPAAQQLLPRERLTRVSVRPQVQPLTRSRHPVPAPSGTGSGS